MQNAVICTFEARRMAQRWCLPSPFRWAQQGSRGLWGVGGAGRRKSSEQSSAGKVETLGHFTVRERTQLCEVCAVTGASR